MVAMESLEASPSAWLLFYSFRPCLASVNQLKVLVASEGCNCQQSHVQKGWMTGGGKCKS